LGTTPEELCHETYTDLTTRRLPFYRLVPLIESLPPKIIITPEWRKLFEEYFYKKFPNNTTKNETFEKIARDIYIRGNRISNMFIDGKKIDSITLVKVCDYIGFPPEIYLKALNLETAPKTAQDKTPQKKETPSPIIIQNTKEMPIQVTPVETKKVIIPEQVAIQKLPLFNYELAAVPTSMKGLIPLMETLPPRVILSDQWRVLFKEYLRKKFNTEDNIALKKLSVLSGVGIVKLGNLYHKSEGIDRVSLVKICHLINLPPEIYFKEINTTMPKMKPL
jgi:hypothetical protein